MLSEPSKRGSLSMSNDRKLLSQKQHNLVIPVLRVPALLLLAGNPEGDKNINFHFKKYELPIWAAFLLMLYELEIRLDELTLF
jgi:hypothetical protein